MSTRSLSKAIDVQRLVTGAAKLEVKLLNAGVETMQVYFNQAARFSTLATETLAAIQDERATLSDTARKFTEFGRQNAQVFSELTQRLSASYFDELDRLAGSTLKSGEDGATTVVAPPQKRRAPRRKRASA